MKRNLLVFGVAVIFGLGMASCSKCVTCDDCNEGVTFDEGDAEICEDDFDSKDEYNDAIELLENDLLFGCTCK